MVKILFMVFEIVIAAPVFMREIMLSITAVMNLTRAVFENVMAILGAGMANFEFMIAIIETKMAIMNSKMPAIETIIAIMKTIIGVMNSLFQKMNS